MIEEYLNGTGNRVRKYTFASAPASKFKLSQHIYLVINSKKGWSLQQIKRDFIKGRMSITDARKNLYAIMTTEKPKGTKSSWKSHTS